MILYFKHIIHIDDSPSTRLDIYVIAFGGMSVNHFSCADDMAILMLLNMALSTQEIEMHGYIASHI